MNRIRNTIRRASRRPSAVALPNNLAHAGRLPIDEAIGGQVLARYEAGLAALDALERDAVVGRVELGLSYSALADRLGKSSPDAARMTVARALLKLAKVMTHS